ncbi:4-hydroxy-tetrahydrodipicolinate synthase [Aquibium carbonis]|uniref:4-hydroxy-tetrahydrodipicolinate synthase n=1 Tax=Aquibium carbonis TaxID=2495581 RepID=A0A3R9YQZ4_9HYPH|nr:4-hydroxy-tetrahydrodipicolinate synthase [Aquibium carbonis]RST84962.1 4-hydroxy-tetrahydrodipicolinate synthase [Aquibium carbonis]
MTFDAERLKGVFTALVTPFRDGKVDTAAFEALVERQIAAGVAGLVTAGTTGEAATLRQDEIDDLVARTVRIARGRVMVIAGAGTNDTLATIEKARRAESSGADGLLVVTPYYNKPSQRGLLQHYGAVADATGLPVMLYSVPGRCGVEIAVETCAALRDRHDNIVAIKEAGGSVERVTRLRRQCGGDFPIHSGDDALTLAFLAAGAVGVTSVVSNVAPEGMVALVRAWQAGDAARALALHEQLAELAEILFIEPNPVPAKAALALEGLANADLRLPLTPMEPANLDRLRGVMHRYRSSGATPLRQGAVGGG